MESGQMYIGSDRRNQPKEPISVPRRIRRLVFRGFGTRMTEGTRETGSFGPGSTNTPFGFRNVSFEAIPPFENGARNASSTATAPANRRLRRVTAGGSATTSPG